MLTTNLGLSRALRGVTVHPSYMDSFGNLSFHIALLHDGGTFHESLRHKAYRVPTFVPNRRTERFQIAIETYRKMHLPSTGVYSLFRNN